LFDLFFTMKILNRPRPYPFAARIVDLAAGPLSGGVETVAPDLAA
jgi:hypothetical protein